jgi:putative copper resistance protein D
MHTLYVLSVFVHIVAATAWIGGMIFFAAVVVPVLRDRELASVYAKVLGAAGARFRVLGWISVATLLVTGVTNLAARGVSLDDLGRPTFWRSPFGSALALKLALVTAILVVTLVHDVAFGARALARAGVAPGSPRALAYRRAASWIGRASLLLSVAAAWVGVVLVRGWP